MRIEPISLYTGGASLGGSITPVGRVRPVNYAKQPEIVAFHEKAPEEDNDDYRSFTLNKAVSFYDRQAGNYDQNGSMAPYDVSGAGFDAQV